MQLEIGEESIPIDSYKISSHAEGSTWLEVAIKIDSDIIQFETSTTQES